MLNCLKICFTRAPSGCLACAKNTTKWNNTTKNFLDNEVYSPKGQQLDLQSWPQDLTTNKFLSKMTSISINLSLKTTNPPPRSYLHHCWNVSKKYTVNTYRNKMRQNCNWRKPNKKCPPAKIPENWSWLIKPGTRWKKWNISRTRCTRATIPRRKPKRQSRKIKRNDGISIAIKYLITGKQME